VTTDTIKATVLRAIGELAPEGDLDRLDPDRPLREQLDLDSYDYLQLMVRLHELVGVEIPERDYVEIPTLTALVTYLASRVTGPPIPGG
jgi:acyl carrier protein